MKITGYGNASVRVDANGQSFFFDTYHKDLIETDESKQQRELRKQAFAEAGRVFITHGHFDHLGSITALYGNQNTMIYCTRTPAKTLRKQGFPAERIHIVRPGERFDFEGVTILTYHTRHCRFNMGEVRDVLFRHKAAGKWRKLFRLLWYVFAYPMGKECLLYEISDGRERIQLLGSAGLDRDTEYAIGADALVLPYQGRSDMAAYCMEIVDGLKPKRVYLDHYDNSFPPMTCMEDTAPFIELMGQKYPKVRCIPLEEGVCFEE